MARKNFVRVGDMPEYWHAWIEEIKRTVRGAKRAGRKPKVTPDHLEAIRKWVRVRKKASRCSLAKLARNLGLSRQTVYSVIRDLGKPSEPLPLPLDQLVSLDYLKWVLETYSRLEQELETYKLE